MKFSSYPTATVASDADTFLMHQASSNAEKQITSLALALSLGASQAVLNIAALKAIDVTLIADGKQMMVSGYYAEHDDGGGLFTYDLGSVAADNTGTIIQPTAGAGRWIRSYKDVLNVKWFGAKGDDVTNDGVAITNAIGAAVPGNTVEFPNSAGHYVVTNPITIPISEITLRGPGRIWGLTGAQYRFFIVSSVNLVIFDGLVFNGRYGGAGSGIGAAAIEIDNALDITIRNCFFANIAQSGVYLFSDCKRVSIENNIFSVCFCAIFSDDDTFTSPTYTKIVGNHIKAGIGAVGTNLSGGIKISGLGTAFNISGHVISNNLINLPGQMGIEIQTNVNSCTISNNVINGAGYGISVSACLKATVTGNAIKNCASYGIEIAGNTARSTVSNNIVD